MADAMPSTAPSGRSTVGAVVAIAATYIYFLLFAQFGFLHLLAARGYGPGQVQASMAAMGITGLAVSLATGWCLRRWATVRLMRVGFASSAVSALLACLTRGTIAWLVVAALVGASVAITTVALATGLRDHLPRKRTGLAVGVGTGMAYFVCNVPPLFNGTAEAQAVASAGAALIGLVACRAMVSRAALRPGAPATVPAALPIGRPAESESNTERSALRPRDMRGLGFVSIVLAFLALVWLDSAAFAVIQETVGLKGQTWGAGAQLWLLGATHFAGALLAGWAIDRGWFRGLLLLAYGLFVVAFTLLSATGANALGGSLLGGSLYGGPLYAIGISLYSTALVLYPSFRPDGPGLVPRRWRAALLYGVAGWFGSANGVGMAQQLHHIPRLFLVAAGALLALGWAVAYWGNQRQAQRTGWLWLLRSHALTLVAAALAALVFALMPGRDATPHPETATVARGRAVYVAEGCLHCHSQFVRPLPDDQAIWGPTRPFDRTESPPLVGNRRQGPDLANVGLRRSVLWQRLHLMAPRSLVPASRMPSYAHLFAPGDLRGDSLVAYLASLGADAAAEHYQATQGYRFEHDLATGNAARGARLFGHWCVPCHGADGYGDGPAAEAFARPAANLRKGRPWLVSWGPGAEPLALALARVVKFGVAGTSMPGHETLPDQDVADLVAHVQTLLGDTVLGDTVPAPVPSAEERPSNTWQFE
jgi:cytochrome c oxidase cbb3-type subunit 2